MDILYSFSAGLTYDLSSARSNRLVREISGGWSLGAFAVARSAPPVDVTGLIFQDSVLMFYPRPNVVPGIPLELFGSGYPTGLNITAGI